MSGQTCFAAFAKGLLGIDGAKNDSKEKWSLVHVGELDSLDGLREGN